VSVELRSNDFLLFSQSHLLLFSHFLLSSHFTSQTHTHTHSLSLSLSRTLSLSLPLSFSSTHSRTLYHPLSLTHSHTLSLSLPLSPSLSLPLSLSHTNCMHHVKNPVTFIGYVFCRLDLLFCIFHAKVIIARPPTFQNLHKKSLIVFFSFFLVFSKSDKKLNK